MKRFLALIVVLFVLSFHIQSAAAVLNPENSHNQDGSTDFTENAESSTASTLELEAEGAVLIEQETGKVLYEKNKDEKLYPASTTKILTALLAIENGNLDEIVTVGNEANLAPRDSSLACIDIGEQITLKDLLVGLLVSSGNDAALTIGAHIGRIVSGDPDMPYNQALDKFYELMNKRAAELEATNSHFVNPHGYHNKDHYTTAYDLALIAREAMKHEVFREIVQITYREYPDWNEVDKNAPTKKATRYWVNKNKLLDKGSKEYYYPHATGIKTGYTSHSGHCLVSSAAKDGMNLIAVVLKSTRNGQWIDSKKLLEYGFEHYTMYEPLKQGQVVATTQVSNHASEDSGALNIVAAQGFRDVIAKEDVAKIQQNIEWYYTDENNQLHLEAPVYKGQVVGKLTYSLNGKVIAQSELIAERGIERKKTIIDMITPGSEDKSATKGLFSSWIVVVILFLAFIGAAFYTLKRRKRRRYTLRRYR
jgi:D-alanyl-D-alanine carboxypeptidase (penicillin-binding protein 5/6)